MREATGAKLGAGSLVSSVDGEEIGIAVGMHCLFLFARACGARVSLGEGIQRGRV